MHGSDGGFRHGRHRGPAGDPFSACSRKQHSLIDKRQFPEPLDAAIIYAPVGALVPSALRAVVPGGTVVCAGIHMTDIPAFPYQLLWGERVVRSIANLTRRDGEEFLALAPRVPVHTQIESFPLDQANEALNRLRAGAVRGAAVLAVNSPAE